VTPPGGGPALAPRERLIVALDTPDLAAAEALVERLAGVVSYFKVGSALFTAAGPPAVEMVRRRGARVFLDLKYHDIPTTVAGAVEAAARLGVALLTVHASGGAAMLRAAAEAARAAGPDRPRIAAVTVLTSLDRAALQGELGVPVAVEGHAVHLAALARGAGCDGVVASPREAARLRAILGRAILGPRALIVTPGIRLAGGAADDQARTATPAIAVRAGADYLVVGRPITAAADPAAAAAAVLAQVPA
jgi:orotidine-5'-phosphate decarboxylase